MKNNPLKKITKSKIPDDKRLIDLEKEAIEIAAAGQVFFEQKKFENTIEQMSKILSRENDFKSFDSFRNALRLTAHSYWRQFNKEKPIELFLRSVKWSEEKNETEEVIKDLSNLGVLFYQSAEYLKSIEYTTQAYNIAIKINYEKGIGFALGNLGNCYFHLGNFEKSLEFQLKASEMAKKLNDQAFLGRCLNTITVLYKNLGQFKKAVENALEAIRIKEKLNEPLGSIYLNIGVIYKEWGDIKKAVSYYKKSMIIFEKENKKDSLAIVLNNLGNLYMDEKDIKLALEYFTKALIIEEEISDKKGILTVLINIGLIYTNHTKDFEKAKVNFDKALNIALEIKCPDSILTVSLKYCDLLLNYGKADDAEILLRNCDKYLDEVDSYTTKFDYFEIYVKLSKIKNDYKKALEYFEKYSKLKDSIFAEENLKTITEMQNKYEAEKKEKEAENYRLKYIELAKMNKEIKKQKEKLENTLNELNESKLKFNIIKEELGRKINKNLVGESQKIKKIIELISVVAKSDKTNVLITGESGTGKEIVANYIHELSIRGKNSFHAINSSAIPDSLFESQFFGHEKNSFTGANNTHIGWFEYANKGTLFLDEIGTVSPDMQSKLLRVLEERKIVRLGSHKEIPVDIRIISATNLDMSDLLEKKKFREDLYHRLATFVIHIPPLRDRKEDIPLLLDHFINLFSKQFAKPINKVESSVISYLSAYNFPGNIRELKNMVERAVIVAESSTLKCSHFLIPDNNSDNTECVIIPLDQVEKEHIRKALSQTNYNQSKTAELLGVERRVIARKIQKYGLSPKKSK